MFELLFYCARADRVDRERVSALAREVTDWGALTDAAEFHGLGASLHCMVDSVCPEKVARLLREAYRDSARRNLILTSKLLELLENFNIEGIPVVPLKGPVLAATLYLDPLLRSFSDLDLLIHREDVPAAVQLMKRQGYALGAHLTGLSLPAVMRLNCEMLFKQDGMPAVDLQWDTAPAEFPFRFDPEVLWNSAGIARIDGREVLSLSPEGLLLFLCVHGAKHLWSRLQWLGDIARLVETPLDWAMALEMAENARCLRPVLLGLLLAHDLLGAPVPEEILLRGRAIPEVAAAARSVGLRLQRIPPVEPESVEIARFTVRMAERTRDKARYYASLVKAPTEVELAWVRLPERLFFLYYPLRFALLVWKYL